MEQIRASGCGAVVLLNVAWFVADGTLSGGPMGPGMTRTDPLLQTQAAKQVTAAAEAKLPPCAGQRSFLYDTAIAPTLPNTAPGDWTERWTVQWCANRVVVPVAFLPDGRGGTVFEVLSEAAVVQ